MQSENFDKKIRDSLSQRPPGNDDPAWDKMETLLDKHMPREKKDRRRVFLILFLFLFTGGGSFLIWKGSTGDKNNITAIESQDKTPGTTKDNNSSADKTAATTTIDDNGPEKISGNSENKTNQPVIGIVPQNSLSEIVPGKDITMRGDESEKIGEKKTNIAATENTDPTPKSNSIDQPNEKQPAVEDDSKKDTEPIDKNEAVKAETQKPITENKTDKPETKESQPLPPVKSNSQKQKNTRSFLDNLFFSVSAGPDFSFLGFEDAGKVQLAYGAGVGYKISDKFSIRTGYYSARKVYTADPDEYDPPYNVMQYYPNLKYIDANCKVHEIPVTIDYTISSNQRSSWFASAGLSTIIMKEEKYDYYFKPNSSPTYITYTRTIYNQNTHYFSQLNISGGYTRNINNNISLRAEPYVKIAMGGVGLGKVDLNSGGILFTGIIKPFAKIGRAHV